MPPPPTNLNSSSKSTSIRYIVQLHHISNTEAQESLGVCVREIGGQKKNSGNKREVTKVKVIFFVCFLFYLINCVCVFTSNKGNHEGAQLANNKVSFSIFFVFFVFHSLSSNVCVCVCVFVHKQLGRRGSNQPQRKLFLFYFLFLIFFHQLCVCVCLQAIKKVCRR